MECGEFSFAIVTVNIIFKKALDIDLLGLLKLSNRLHCRLVICKNKMCPEFKFRDRFQNKINRAVYCINNLANDWFLFAKETNQLQVCWLKALTSQNYFSSIFLILAFKMTWLFLKIFWRWFLSLNCICRKNTEATCILKKQLKCQVVDNTVLYYQVTSINLPERLNYLRG